jgi:hypothetical protein
LAHRAAIAGLLYELKRATTIEETRQIEAEMCRVADEYHVSVEATTVALRAENDQLAAKLRDLEGRQRPVVDPRGCLETTSPLERL